MARATVLLAEAEASGLIHVVGPEVIDRVGFARAIAAAFGHDLGLIVAKTTAELGQGAPRPLNGGLKTPRLDALYPGIMRPLAAALENFHETLLDPGFGQWIQPVAGSPINQPPRETMRRAAGG